MMLLSIDFFCNSMSLERKKIPPALLHQGPQKNIKNTYVDEHSNPIENVQKLICSI